MFLLLLLLLQKSCEPSKQQKRLRLLRNLIIPKKYSALFHLSRQAEGFISLSNCEGFERIFRLNISTFQMVLKLFGPLYSRVRLNPQFPRRRKEIWKSHGRPSNRSLNPDEVLLTILRMLAVGPHLDDVSLLSGTCGSTLSRALTCGFSCLYVVLQKWHLGNLAF